MPTKREATKKAIINAFTTLAYEQEDVKTISVKSIIDRAQISRSTFYAYFDNIGDITAEMAKLYGQDLRAEMKKNTYINEDINGYRGLYYRLLTYIKDHRKIAETILLNYSNSEVTEAISQPVLETMYGMLRKTHMDVDKRTLQYAATKWGYGFYGSMKMWLKDGCQPEIEEMSAILEEAASFTNDFIFGVEFAQHKV